MTHSDGEFVFSVAGPADEPELRRLVASVPMPGAISIRFEREPDYFLGCSVMGDVCEVIVARTVADGELAGFMCRTERRAFVDGVEQVIGGIGQVRIPPRFRGRRLLQRGWPAFGRRELLYTGVIARDNPRAVSALVGRAPGAPSLTRVGGLTTLGLVVRRRGRTPAPSAGRVSRLGADRLEEYVDVLRREGARRQFAPAYRVEDVTGGTLLRGLAVDDVLVAERDGRIVGTMAYWDQRAYKQDVVDSYGPALRRLRLVLDVAVRTIGASPLPPPGHEIGTVFAALVAVADDDPAVFSDLLDACLAEARRRGVGWLMLGLADTDPLLPVARRRLHVTYRSDLYAAAWRGIDPGTRFDGRPPYVEIATL